MRREDLGEKDGFPGKPTSVWLDTTSETNFQALSGNIETDVVVVGAGIAGIMTAYLLLESGLKITVVEGGKIIEDVTAYTTAKITALHGDIYHYLIQNFGEAKAKMYADANRAGLLKIIQIIVDKKIQCELKKESAYIYTEKTENRKKLKIEAEAARKLGFDSKYTENTPLDFIKGAVEFKNQAQFHPRKFLLSISRDIIRQGQIFENTRALDIEKGGKPVLVTNRGKIKARYIVVTTNFPFYDTEKFYSKLFPHRSYVLGLKLRQEIPEGMYFSIDGYRESIRNQGKYGNKILLVGGGTEKAEENADTLEYYYRVLDYAKKRFEIESIKYHWFTQDNHTPDRVPYIGRIAKSENIFVATGFGDWGMTTGAAAGIILSDLIEKRVNAWVSLFDPGRSTSIKSAKSFIGENIKTGKHIVGKKFQKPPFDMPANIIPGEGKIIRIQNKNLAVYKDKKGKIYVLSPICTHMGCTVNWNKTEKTWDCPCHGSRYNYDGKVIHGPAVRDLKKEEI